MHCSLTSSFKLLPADLTKDQFELLPQSQQLMLKKKMTLRHFQTFMSQKAEAGYYVELAVFGGILSFQDDKCASYALFAAFHSIGGFAVKIILARTMSPLMR